jgi:hypothetical protein
MRQLLEFLAFAHDECNIVHRDIKPENLLLLDTDAPQSQERVARLKAAGGNPEGVEAMALKVGQCVTKGKGKGCTNRKGVSLCGCGLVVQEGRR